MSDHLASTTAKPRTCPGCGSPTLVGLDRGLPFMVDANEITPEQEIAILLTGRWTYVRTTKGQMLHRTPERIRSKYLTGTIHAEHQCPTKPLF